MLLASDYPAPVVAGLRRGRTVSVVIPARNEAATIGEVVSVIGRDLMGGAVDELVVVDDGSTDGTADVARQAGATVVGASPDHGGSGKGQAMWQGLQATGGDVVAFCDGDIRSFDARFVLGVVGPLLEHPGAAFAKAAYSRPLDGRPGEGGRVTELAARPLVALLFPHLAGIDQPLAGECAGRRDVLESVPFVDGYGVDLGLLVDISARYGTESILQCDLGERVHRNRPLAQLSPQALAIWQLGLVRAGVVSPGAATPLRRPALEPQVVTHGERPPVASLRDGGPALRR